MSSALKPKRCLDEVIEMISVWDIGASGAHTKASGVPGTGFDSVTRTAAGEYRITFGPDVPAGGLIDLKVTHWAQADTEPFVTAPYEDYSASAKTVSYGSWVVDETAAATDLPSGDKVTIRATFLKTK